MIIFQTSREGIVRAVEFKMATGCKHIYIYGCKFLSLAASRKRDRDIHTFFIRQSSGKIIQ